jgi:hypothetical protein
MSDYRNLIEKIIENQEENFGPVALENAENVEGIEIEDGEVTITAEDEEAVLMELVQEYHRLVGEAVSAALEQEEIDDQELWKKLEDYFSRSNP